MFADRLRTWAAARGYRIATAPVEVLDVVRRKLEGRRDSGMIAAGFFAKNLSGFRYLNGCSIEGPRMLVMAAVPSPVSILPLRLDGRRIDGLIPPTYVRYKKTFEDVLADMKVNVLDGADDTTGAEILSAPLKSLAVHMGLVSYGRNNITYAPGLGSGYQLCGYIVDMRDGMPESAARSAAGGERGRAATVQGKGEVQGGGRTPEWNEAFMDRCSSCRACLEACPTGAIREDRFLISAERCYTLFSESKEPIPEWIRLPQSRCLIGCMACQEICPENKGLLRYEASGEEFTAEETEAVFDMGRRFAAGGEAGSGAGGRLALESARDKFQRLGISEDVEVIARNLWISRDHIGQRLKV